jgi:hypothetical protein
MAVLRQEGPENKRADLFSCMLIGCKDNLENNPRMVAMAMGSLLDRGGCDIAIEK